MRKLFSMGVAVSVALVMSFGFIATVQAQPTNQLLAAPKVDDVYAGRVDYVSDYIFGDSEEVYGLMRVIEVSPAEIVVITTDSAWDDADDALEELRGDFSDTNWDPSEEIVIKRAELASLKKEGILIEARRLTAEQIKALLD